MADQTFDDEFRKAFTGLLQQINSFYAPYISSVSSKNDYTRLSTDPSLNPGAQALSGNAPSRAALAGDTFNVGTDTYYKLQEPGGVYDEQNNVTNYANTRNRLKGPLQEIQQTPDWGTQLNELQNNNFAKQARHGNLNNKPYKNTLFLSRLADAFNNNRRWVPTETGYRTNSKFGTQAAKVGYSERWDPITTQETRQMRANEAIDSAQRQQDVQLQAAINKYPLDVQRTIDNMSQQLALAMGQDAISFKRVISEALYSLSHTEPSKLNMNMIMQTYLQYMAKEVSIDAVTTILNFLEENSLLTNVYLKAIAGAESPDLLQVANTDLMHNLYEASNGNPITFQQNKALLESAFTFSGIYPKVAQMYKYGMSATQPTNVSTDVLRRR